MLKEAFVNSCGIEAPASGEQRDFFDVGVDAVVKGKRKRLGWIRVVEAFEAEFAFSQGEFALIPQSSAGPGVRTDNAAMVDFNPCMMMESSAGVEQLDSPEFATDIEQKTETGIYIVARFGQA